MKKYFVSFFLVCFGIALVAAPASATFLFAGGEDLDFTPAGTTLGVNTTNCFNSTYAREAVYANNYANAYYIETPFFTSSTTFWVHYDMCATTQYVWYNNPIFVLADSNGVMRLCVEYIQNDYAGSTIKLYKTNAAQTYTLLASSSSIVNPDPLITIDVYVNYGASGTFTFYANGSQILTYSGDLTTDGNSSLAQLWLGVGAYQANYTYYSQVIVSTTDTRSMHLATMYPAANGNTMAWTGSVSSINATTYNDTNIISSATSGQLAEFTASALPSGSYTVAAVVQSARASAAAGGPQHLEFDTRTGGTSYQSANQALSTGMALYQYVWSTNPNTSVAWTTSDLGAAGFNLGVESQT